MKKRKHLTGFQKIMIVLGFIMIGITAGTGVTVKHHNDVKKLEGPVTENAIAGVGNIRFGGGVVTAKMQEAAEYLDSTGLSGRLYQENTLSQLNAPDSVLKQGITDYFVLEGDNSYICVKTADGFIHWDPETQECPLDKEIADGIDLDSLEGNVIFKAIVPKDYNGNVFLTITGPDSAMEYLYLQPEGDYTGSVTLACGTDAQYTGQLSAMSDQFYVYASMFEVPESGRTVQVVHVVPINDDPNPAEENLAN